ncbi:sulfatase-like hydrolase/transferase [Tichowtungia aerotolerans]|uniref:Sulfatase-like hydrolase/transferase n=2 Tax=Tichowtungia aerotolerans TaxID=2697043 RepID=A0A6P1MH59_9BACT|nr:sulfatase-like hydrolase/transferase [Tichowtungia aerotolerans]
MAAGTAALPFASKGSIWNGKSGQPNFLVICCDQLQSVALACNGNPDVKTPNIDRLAREGCSFRRAYCNNSVCMPARATMMTGLYPRQHGCITNGTKLPEDIPTLPQVLSRHGYRTHAVGKLHFQPLSSRDSAESLDSWMDGTITSLPDNYYGFQSSDFIGGHVNYCFGDYTNELRRDHPGVYEKYSREHAFWRSEGMHQTWKMTVPPELHYNTWIAEKTIRVMDENKDNPFFVWCSFPDPHFPFAASEPYADMYDPSKLSICPTAFEPVDEPRTLQKRRDFFGKQYQFDEKSLRATAAQYYGMITHIDDSIGKMLDAMNRNGLLENTIIVFLADHGEYLGSHHLIQKADWMYEELARVPMIWRVPGTLRAGKGSDSVVSQVDLVPTVLDYTGIDVSEFDTRKNFSAPPVLFPGRSLRPVLSGTDVLEEKPAFLEYDEDWHASGFYRVRTLIDSRYKLIVYTHTGGGQLFDLKTDPYERNDLWDSAEHRAIKVSMMEALLREASTYDRVDQKRVCGA